MTISDKRKKRLFEELKNKEERDAYLSSSVDVGVAFQIRALREQRNWNQTKLADEAKMQQERISTLENPSHSPTLATLKKLASAFDVGLIVRFAPISELVKYELNLHSKSLEVPSFEEEEYFKEKPIYESSKIFLTANIQGTSHTPTVEATLLKDHYSKDASDQPGSKDVYSQYMGRPKVAQISDYFRKKKPESENEEKSSIQDKISNVGG